MKPVTKALNFGRLHLTGLVNWAVAAVHELTTDGLRYGKRGLEGDCTVCTTKGATELLYTLRTHAPLRMRPSDATISPSADKKRDASRQSRSYDSNSVCYSEAGRKEKG